MFPLVLLTALVAGGMALGCDPFKETEHSSGAVKPTKRFGQGNRFKKSLPKLNPSDGRCSSLQWTYVPRNKKPLNSPEPAVSLPVQQLMVSDACLHLSELSIQDPIYRAKKTYEGFYLSDLLNQTKQSEKFTHFRFTCADGFIPPMIPIDEFGLQGFLAVRDISSKATGGDSQDWSGFPDRPDGRPRPGTPAPSYLVWPPGHPHYQNLDQWPYQVVSIELVDMKNP